MVNKRTKIVCTIGPASESVETIVKMIKAGMNVARLNFSHGTHENHALLIKNVREAEKITGEPIAIMQDLQGPKIRLGVLPEKGVAFKKLPKAVVAFFESFGALMFLGIALLGFMSGYFFINFIAKGEPFRLFSAGIIPLCNIAISLKVGAGLFAIFVALVLLKFESEGKR